MGVRLTESAKGGKGEKEERKVMGYKGLLVIIRDLHPNHCAKGGV